MDKLIEAIREKLNISDNLYINMEIEGYLEHVDPLDYKDFFTDLSGDKFAYKNGMDRVAIVSDSYKERKVALINRNVKTKANMLADKLYTLKQQVNNNYEHIKYNEITLTGENFLCPKELMVIEKIDMNLMMKDIDTKSTQDSVDKINTVMERINQAAAEKMAISLNDKKLLK